ncbi:MAG: hypothetical protein HN521_04520 [Candidatus Latescibacteria bacterium]|nr:hypothetical protein [Candidatus Latescibacterota bacterium]
MDQQIDHDLQAIQERLLSAFEGIEGLVLVGGFGRGEGGLVLKDGKYRPENDYDLEMITNQPVDTEKLLETERGLAQDLGVSWVHIENRQKQNLSRLPFTQYVYDLKYGGRILYGPEEMLDEIPDMNNANLPLAEGEKLLHTRLWCFLGPYTTEFEERQPTDEEAVFMASQMSKAILAICDANLMLKHDYQVQYQNKSSHFLSNIGAKEELRDLVRWATDYKLRPAATTIPPPLPLYSEVREHFLDNLFRFAQAARKTKFQSWVDYGEKFYGWVSDRPRKDRVKQKLKVLIGRAGPPTRYNDLVRLKLYMVLAGDVTNQEQYLEKIQAILRQHSPDENRSDDWETLRKHTLQLLDI